MRPLQELVSGFLVLYLTHLGYFYQTMKQFAMLTGSLQTWDREMSSEGAVGSGLGRLIEKAQDQPPFTTLYSFFFNTHTFLSLNSSCAYMNTRKEKQVTEETLSSTFPSMGGRETSSL